MFKRILSVVLALLPFLSSYLNKKKQSEKIALEKQLAEAIKSGDAETVARIREMLKNYASVVLVILSLVFLSGCFSTYKDIPLTEGSIPYRLKPGVYVDTDGKAHNEQNYRWSLSEADLFRDTKKLEEPVSPWKTVASDLKDYVPFVCLLVMILFYIGVTRKKK